MAIEKSLEKLNIAAMEETLKAAQILLALKEVEDNNPPIFFKGLSDNNCRYGYPAAILLFSFIEAAGCLYYPKSTASNTYKVLNDDVFQYQKLSNDALISLYDYYRSKLVHNLILPPNAMLDCKSGDEKVFSITKIGGKDAIASVNLYYLLALCQTAFEKIRSKHSELFGVSKNLLEVIRKPLLDEPKSGCLKSPSGYTTTDNF